MIMQQDKIMQLLDQAFIACKEAEQTERSRELALVITKIEEAMLWRGQDITNKEFKK